MSGCRRRCRRPGGARCLHLRRVAPLPTGSPLFHSRLQRRRKSSGAHIGEGKGREEGTNARATRAHQARLSQPSPAPPPGDGDRPLHAVAIGKTPGFSYAPQLLPSWLEEEREQMCQSSARGRRRLRRPSLVRLIAPTRHLPLPPAPPIQSPSRGEERQAGRGGRCPLLPT